MRLEDYEFLKENVRDYKLIAASAWMRNNRPTVRYHGHSIEDTNFQGVTANIINIGQATVESGRFITESDYAHSAPVAFVGQDLVTEFFPNVDPLGKEIMVGGNPFQTTSIYALIHTLEQRWGVWFAMGGTGALVAALVEAELPVVVANPRQVQAFARATGQLAKTDALDAQVLARYAAALQPPERPQPDAAQRRLRGGFSVLPNYTLSKCTSDPARDSSFGITSTFVSTKLGSGPTRSSRAPPVPLRGGSEAPMVAAGLWQLAAFGADRSCAVSL